MDASNSQMPRWRLRARKSLRPYRRALTVLFLAVAATLCLDSWLGWGLVGLAPRMAEALALLAGLLWLVFVGPDASELRTFRTRN